MSTFENGDIMSARLEMQDKAFFNKSLTINSEKGLKTLVIHFHGVFKRHLIWH